MRERSSSACCASDGRTLPHGAAQRDHAAHVFRALADRTRLEIFALIASRPEPLCVCDIVARFELSQPTISHHLKLLRRAGLVSSTRRGRWSYYEVDPHGASAARAAMDAVLPSSGAPVQ